MQLKSSQLLSNTVSDSHPTLFSDWSSKSLLISMSFSPWFEFLKKKILIINCPVSFANVAKKGQFEDVGTSSSVVHSAVEECKCVMLCVFLCSSPDQLVKPGWIQQGPWLLRRNSATPTWRGRGAGGWAARPSAANTISHPDLRISLQFNSSCFKCQFPTGHLTRSGRASSGKTVFCHQQHKI